jgi:hypothetical protein
MSRNKFYLRSIIKCLQKRRNGRVTKKLNEIYDKELSSLDSGFHEIQIVSIDKEDW